MSIIDRTTKLEDLPEFLSLQEYAAFVDVSLSAAYEHLQTRQIHAVKFGRFWRIPKAALVAKSQARELQPA